MSSSMILHTPTGGTLTIDHFNVASNAELESIREDAWKNINTIKTRISQLVVATPKDVFPPNDEGDPLYQINREFEELWDWLEDEYQILQKCRIVQEMVYEWEYGSEWENGEDGPKRWDPSNQEDWEKMAPDMYADEREAWKETLAQFSDCPEEIKKSIMTEDVTEDK